MAVDPLFQRLNRRKCFAFLRGGQTQSLRIKLPRRIVMG
jgi:hypothetical protein